MKYLDSFLSYVTQFFSLMLLILMPIRSAMIAVSILVISDLILGIWASKKNGVEIIDAFLVGCGGGGGDEVLGNSAQNVPRVYGASSTARLIVGLSTTSGNTGSGTSILNSGTQVLINTDGHASSICVPSIEINSDGLTTYYLKNIIFGGGANRTISWRWVARRVIEG